MDHAFKVRILALGTAAILGLVSQSQVNGQSAAVAPAVGRGFVANSRSTGLVPLPPGWAATGVSGNSGNSAGTAAGSTGLAAQGQLLTDPLGFGYVYGGGGQMNNTQAGLLMLSVQQRMLGIGNGQLSGVRPGPMTQVEQARLRPQAASSRQTAAHTRDMNVPGGQAARFFNRSGVPAQRARPFYNRQNPQYPQISQ